MLSAGGDPICVFEDTTHIVRMNVYQRIPRLVRACIMGTPAIVLQGTRGLDFRMRGDCWAMHRYMRAFAAISRRYPNSAALPFMYIPSEKDSEPSAECQAFAYIKALVAQDREGIVSIRERIRNAVEEIERSGFLGQVAPHIPSIVVNQTEVFVNVGARPEKKSWREKGSGQMDPYIGLIAAAKYIYCFDDAGAQVRQMIVRFTHLPSDFWWFRGWRESRSLYKTLAFEIADEVQFCGT